MKKQIVLVLVLGCTAACVTTKSEGEAMRADIDGLRTELKKQQDTAAVEREKLAQESASRAKALQDALDQLGRAARKSGRTWRSIWRRRRMTSPRCGGRWRSSSTASTPWRKRRRSSRNRSRP